MTSSDNSDSKRWLWFIRVTAVITWPIFLGFMKWSVSMLITLDKNQALITSQLINNSDRLQKLEIRMDVFERQNLLDLREKLNSRSK